MRNKNLYDMNETMRMIGQTDYYQYLNPNDFNNLLSAHSENKSSVYSLVIDAFVLGMITGIRQERSKRHSKAK